VDKEERIKFCKPSVSGYGSRIFFGGFFIIARYRAFFGGAENAGRENDGPSSEA